MGFKPKSALKRYFHVKPAHFIFPDESVSPSVDNSFIGQYTVVCIH